MLSHRVVLTLAIVGVAAVLVTVTQASPASAEGGSANYNFLVASGFLCDPNDSTTCPAVARAANGNTIELSGAGTLNPSSKSITAAGAFAHKNSAGKIVETGVWTATELLSFKSYGIAPGALLRGNQKFRTSGILPIGRGLLAGPMPTGGLALLRVRLWPDSGKPKEAFLQVNCAKGKVPENQQGDGVRLAIQEGGPKFDQKVSGRTVFMLRKPGLNLSPKRPVPGTN
ncbi:MAG: hypothetical protein DMG06_23315 [Acidobacteria bacterium]|nr:MAG: hypothetical protein DMG06_23315 [Acidobacteriota bacterium]